MVPLEGTFSIPVMWRKTKYVLEVTLETSLKEMGEELHKLTGVKEETLKLIIPQSLSKSSKLFIPFSNEHSCLKIRDVGLTEGKPLQMMGVSAHEVDQLQKDANKNLRIAGFEEEDKRMMQRLSRGPELALKLPPGPYIFCEFRTLELPGVKLDPPPSEALKRMHILAADPGIVAIMNKHRWRVGIMTEMAPEGYVGISPVCVLGLNKNHGEEISLRLRTDDLRGFRKYDNIKKTLLHELAHMVFSEHNSDFYALDRQLNEEAFALDWTKARGHTLGDVQFSRHVDMDMEMESNSNLNLPHKLGGESSEMAAPARAASVAAAYSRLVGSFTAHEEQGLVDHVDGAHEDSELVDADYREDVDQMISKPIGEVNEDKIPINSFQVNDDIAMTEPEVVPRFTDGGKFETMVWHEEPDPDDVVHAGCKIKAKPSSSSSVDSQPIQIDNMMVARVEPDPDDSEARFDTDGVITSDALNGGRNQTQLSQASEPDPDDLQEKMQTQSGPDDTFSHQSHILGVISDEPGPNDEQAASSNRLHQVKKALEKLMPADVDSALSKYVDRLRAALEKMLALKYDYLVVLQTLSRIIRNILENPSEVKYKRIRKANPTFQRNVGRHEVAMELLSVIGFVEDNIFDENGKMETFVVLKRDDPGRLWLTKSIFELYNTDCIEG